MSPETRNTAIVFRLCAADNGRKFYVGRRLKTLRGLTPYEAICKAWSVEPSRFRSNLLRQMPGPNI